mmetsp:Transcript_30944/g.54269  ORF Transcript_30944/g.54269 Transcript_30944/m.54269 type:complete len:248 (+) Transcript_30944:135-878(+)
MYFQICWKINHHYSSHKNDIAGLPGSALDLGSLSAFPISTLLKLVPFIRYSLDSSSSATSSKRISDSSAPAPRLLNSFLSMAAYDMASLDIFLFLQSSGFFLNSVARLLLSSSSPVSLWEVLRAVITNFFHSGKTVETSSLSTFGVFPLSFFFCLASVLRAEDDALRRYSVWAVRALSGPGTSGQDAVTTRPLVPTKADIVVQRFSQKWGQIGARMIVTTLTNFLTRSTCMPFDTYSRYQSLADSIP